MQGTWVRSLVWEDATCCRATKPMYHNCWVCLLEAVLCKKRHHCVRSPCIAMKSSSCFPQLEKALIQQWGPSTAKINKCLKNRHVWSCTFLKYILIQVLSYIYPCETITTQSRWWHPQMFPCVPFNASPSFPQANDEQTRFLSSGTKICSSVQQMSINTSVPDLRPILPVRRGLYHRALGKPGSNLHLFFSLHFPFISCLSHGKSLIFIQEWFCS